MSKLFDHFQQTRSQLLNRARAVSAYFKRGGGVAANDDQERPPLAWTSEEQKKRSQEFRDIANKLNNKDEAA